jgi:UDP-N-acetyl-D-glucosamine dehydrogenase
MNSDFTNCWSTSEQIGKTLAANSLFTLLSSRLESRTAKIGIIGRGAIGMQLAARFARKGFLTAGYHIDPPAVDRLGRKSRPLQAIPSRMAHETFVPRANFATLTDMDAVLICDPKPANGDCEPDPRFVEDAAFEIAQHLRHGQLILLESAPQPGTPDELLISILEESGLHCPVVPYRTDGHALTSGEAPEPDFFLGYSSERKDLGRRRVRRAEMPKTVGGVNGPSALAAQALLQCVFERTLIVSSPRTAEMARVLQNIERGANFLHTF